MYTVVFDGLVTSLILSLIPMVAIAIVAGVVALIQAVTQVQEQSLVHLARLGAMAGCLLVGGHLAFAELQRIFIDVVMMVGAK